MPRQLWLWLWSWTFVLGALAGPALAGEDTAPRRALERAFAAQVQQGFSGAIVIISEDGRAQHFASGEARPGEPYAPDIPADVGSIAKPVTAMAILRLEQDDKLSLEDPLQRWFPTAPADRAGITLRQMLTHTSGLPEYVEGAEDYTPMSEADLATRVFSQPLQFAPGESFGYSNTAYNLLAVIVAKASGRSYADYVEDAVFAPAGVRGSFDPARFARVAEMRKGGEWTDIRTTAAAARGPFWGLWGAGGLFVSASDLARLMQAFAQKKILSLATVEALREPALPLDERNAAGLVWGLVMSPSGGWSYYFNSGSQFGTADIRYDPDANVIVSVTANSERPSAIQTGRAIAEALLASPEGKAPGS